MKKACIGFTFRPCFFYAFNMTIIERNDRIHRSISGYCSSRRHGCNGFSPWTPLLFTWQLNECIFFWKNAALKTWERFFFLFCIWSGDRWPGIGWLAFSTSSAKPPHLCSRTKDVWEKRGAILRDTLMHVPLHPRRLWGMGGVDAWINKEAAWHVYRSVASGGGGFNRTICVKTGAPSLGPDFQNRSPEGALLICGQRRRCRKMMSARLRGYFSMVSNGASFISPGTQFNISVPCLISTKRFSISFATLMTWQGWFFPEHFFKIFSWSKRYIPFICDGDWVVSAQHTHAIKPSTFKKKKKQQLFRQEHSLPGNYCSV